MPSCFERGYQMATPNISVWKRCPLGHFCNRMRLALTSLEVVVYRQRPNPSVKGTSRRRAAPYVER